MQEFSGIAARAFQRTSDSSRIESLDKFKCFASGQVNKNLKRKKIPVSVPQDKNQVKGNISHFSLPQYNFQDL